MKRIAIRADGNSKIGFGHLVRMQALARQLEKFGAEPLFFSRNPENISGFVTVPLGSADPVGEDRELGDLLTQYEINMLIIDSYAYDQARLDFIGEGPVTSLYIDDMNQHIFNTSWVVNGNLYAPGLDYQGQAKFLLGADYLLLREEFSELTARKTRPEVEDVLLTVGAADTENLTPQLIRLLLKYPRFARLRWHIVLGPAFKNHGEIEALVVGQSNLYCYRSPAMKDLMTTCDIAISAAGSTSYELAACGVPAILLVAVDNQMLLAEELEKRQIAFNLGWHEHLNREALHQALDQLLDDRIARQAMSDRGQALIDGRGTERLAKLLIKDNEGAC